MLKAKSKKKEESKECYELKGEEINQLNQIFDIIYTIKSLHHLNKPNLFLKNSHYILLAISLKPAPAYWIWDL